MSVENKNATMNWIKQNDLDGYNDAVNNAFFNADASKNLADETFKEWLILSATGSKALEINFKTIINVVARGPPTCFVSGLLAFVTLVLVLILTLCRLC